MFCIVHLLRCPIISNHFAVLNALSLCIAGLRIIRAAAVSPRRVVSPDRATPKSATATLSTIPRRHFDSPTSTDGSKAQCAHNRESPLQRSANGHGVTTSLNSQEPAAVRCTSQAQSSALLRCAMVDAAVATPRADGATPRSATPAAAAAAGTHTPHTAEAVTSRSPLPSWRPAGGAGRQKAGAAASTGRHLPDPAISKDRQRRALSAPRRLCASVAASPLADRAGAAAAVVARSCSAATLRRLSTPHDHAAALRRSAGSVLPFRPSPLRDSAAIAAAAAKLVAEVDARLLFQLRMQEAMASGDAASREGASSQPEAPGEETAGEPQAAAELAAVAGGLGASLQASSSTASYVTARSRGSPHESPTTSSSDRSAALSAASSAAARAGGADAACGTPPSASSAATALGLSSPFLAGFPAAVRLAHILTRNQLK